MTGPQGVLVVDKPTGMTSHDVVAAARRRFQTRAVGHAGTLDPLATGVLLLMFGEATKLSPYLTADDKRYRAVVSFGATTDTLDAQGQTIEQRALAAGWLTPQALESALALERARSEQVPPAFSAIKVGGERAHRLSRRGDAPELAAREIAVRELELELVGDHSITLVLTVSKGYYVRSLARDLCGELGVPGHLAELRRLQSGSFGVDEAVPWPPGPDARLLSVSEAARRCLPCAELVGESVARARQGRELGNGDFSRIPPSAGPAAWLDPQGTVVAIGQPTSTCTYRVLRGFAADQDGATA